MKNLSEKVQRKSKMGLAALRIPLVISIFILFSWQSSAQYIDGPGTACPGGVGAYSFYPGFDQTFDRWELTPSFAGSISDTFSPYMSITFGTSYTGNAILTAHYRNSTFQYFTITRSITIAAAPAPTLSGPEVACVGTTGNVYTTESGRTNYVWTVSSGGTITSGGGSGNNSVTVTWTTAGARSVSVRYTTSGCVTPTTTRNVTVNTVPTATVSGPATSCEGTSATYTTESGMSNYSWTVSPGGTITAGGGSSNNSVTVTWTTAGARSVSVNYFSGIAGCTSNSGTRNVTVNTQPVPSFTDGPVSACSNTSGHVYTTQPGMTSYVWSISPGGTITAGGGASDNTATVTWQTEGAQSISVNYTHADGCTGAAPATRAVTVDVGPLATISGNSSFCPGGSLLLTAGAGPGYTFQWKKDGATLSGQTAQTLEVSIAGDYTVVVLSAGNCSAESAVKSVTEGQPPSAITSITGLRLNFVEEQSRLQVQGAPEATSFIWTAPAGVTTTPAGGNVSGREVLVQASAAGTHDLTVKAVLGGCESEPFPVAYTALSALFKNEELTMAHAELQGNAEGYIFLPKHGSHYEGCINTYGPVTLKAALDLGNDYNLGKRNFTATVTVTITAYYDLPGVEQSWPVTLQINSSAPEQVFVQEITTLPYQLKFIGVKIDTYANSDPDVAAQFIRLKVIYNEEDEVDVSAVTVQSVGETHDAQSWEATFIWESCPDVTNYEFQLVRTFEGTHLDWSEALTIFTESAATSLTLAMAEGTDMYRWRVRAIGNKPGGISNPANWSPNWSGERSFQYTHPEEGRNWIYSRTFTEGNRVSEQVVYANGLQQISQQQTRIQGDNQIVAAQTIQDFAGRNAVSSLPIPVANVNKLGYIGGLLKAGADTYGVQHFDADVRNPAFAVDLGGYYSGTDNGFNDRVASAQGFPYTRTVFTSDGTGRVKEQSGVGYMHSLKDTETRESHTVRTFYSNPSEGELLRLFGREVPDHHSVQKVTTYDANGTASIAYKTKDGKVIATALAITGSTGPLTALPSRAAGTQMIYQEVKGNVREGDNVIVSRKPLLFTTDTDLVVDYEITPGTIADICSSLCKTCDYTIEFRLYREGVQLPTYTNLPAPHTINAGECSQQSSLAWNPAPFTLPALQGGVDYVLEKRITTHNRNASTEEYFIDEHNNTLRSYYDGQVDAAMAPLNIYLDNDDLTGLYSFLDANPATYPFDNESQQYIISVGTGPACQEFIFISKVELCPEKEPSGCLLNGLDFEAYFADHYADDSEITVLTPGGLLDYAFFRNQHTGVKMHFAPGQLNQMFANLMVDNTLVTCEVLWEVWRQQVSGYKARQKTVYNTSSATDDPIMIQELAKMDLENDLLQSVLLTLDGKLMAEMNETDNDICAGSRFIKRNIVYGYFSADGLTTTGSNSADAMAPDLTIAYKLVYFNEAVEDMANALRYYAGIDHQPVLTVATFGGLIDCNKFKLSRTTRFGDQDLGDWEEEKNKRVALIQGRCGVACELRAEEFRQAIIRDLYTKNQNVVIEHYTIHYNEFTQTHIGVLDTLENGTGFDYSVCQLNAMVDALVENCKINYCNTPLTVFDDPVTGARLVGTELEWEELKKAMFYEFEVGVDVGGIGCPNGWDYLPDGTSNSFDNNFFPIKTITIPGQFSGVGFGYGIDNYEVVSGGYVYTTRQIFRPFPLNDYVRYIAKINLNGSLEWFETIGTGYKGGNILRIELDNQYNLYVQGINPLVNNTNEDLWITHYSTQGVWTGLYNYNSEFEYFTLNHSGIPYAIGYADEIEAGNEFIIRHASTQGPGDFVTAITIKGRPVTGEHTRIKFNSAGELILWFSYSHAESGFVRLGEGEPNEITFHQNSGEVLAVYNSDHTLKWAKYFPLTSSGSGMFVSDYSGNTFLINPSNPSIITKLDSNGDVLWTKVLPEVSVNSGRVNINAQNSLLTFFSEVNDEQIKLIRLDLLNGNIVEEILMNFNFKGFPYCVEYGSDIYIFTHVSTSINPDFFLKYPTLESTGEWNYVMGKYRVGASCSSPPLCFRFTTMPSLGVEIPTDMEDVVYNPQELTCEVASATSIRASVVQQQEQLVNRRVDVFREQYRATCANPALVNDKLVLNYSMGYHHFTLYYYDRAGNLMRTVPPQGVVLTNVNTPTNLANARNVFPNHTMVTEYQYNSLGQLVREHSPDGTPKPNNLTQRPPNTSSESELNASDYYSTFIYNDKGQLRFSRNAKQKGEGSYSYTKYDELGRVIEVGEATAFDEATLLAQRNNNSGYPSANTRFLTRTFYTEKVPEGILPAGYTQGGYLRNRVSFSYTDEDGNDLSDPDDRVYSIYNYDPHGNVDWLVQNIPGMPARGMKYEYDLISGKVTKVMYSPGEADEFYHRYEYDANNRIREVFTSKDGNLWEREADYEYYLHGPLKRMVLGEDKLQGIDYTYTIHGWLKAFNHPLLDIGNDPGGDGDATSAVGRDAFGMTLGYFSGDYEGAHTQFMASHSSNLNPLTGRDLYNGNIASWSSNMRYPAAATITYKQLTGQTFVYDELNRLLVANFNTYGGSSYSAVTPFTTNTIAYSPNGNITTMRNHASGTIQNMDNLIYHYTPGTNRLRHVKDTYAATPSTDVDVENQPDDNYGYDAIGNLLRDDQQETTIHWNVYGKVSRVVKDNSAYTQFLYDAAGNRVAKKRVNASGLSVTSFYLRDASGNIMGVYEKAEESGQAPEIVLNELSLYGSDRLGLYTRSVQIEGSAGEETPLEPGETRITEDVEKNEYEGLSYLVNPGVELTLGQGFSYTSTDGGIFTVRVGAAGGTTAPMDGYHTRYLASRRYELKDHLGNVRTVITDTKLSTINTNTPGAYEAEVVGTYNYYPFGMEMPGRSWTATGKYRYGFNGKEKDDNGEFGNTHYDYGFRIYNPALGRFLSTDPLLPDYPELTPYQFASNMPINSIDLDGLEQLVSITTERSDRPIFYKVSDEDGRRVIERQFWTAFRQDLDPSKYVWLKGEKEYKRYGSLYAPLFGTLNVDVKSDKTYFSFDPTQHSRIKRDFSIIDSYQKFRQTYRGEQFEETLSNVALAGSMIITGGASSSIRLSGGAAKFLQSSFGKGVFDLVGQAIVMGDINKIDISDAAASAFVGNKYLKNLVKSFADLTIEGGFSEENIKGINEGLAEFGLRIGVDAANSPIKGGASNYVIDVIKKEQRKEVKSTFSGSN